MGIAGEDAIYACREYRRALFSVFVGNAGAYETTFAISTYRHTALLHRIWSMV